MKCACHDYCPPGRLPMFLPMFERPILADFGGRVQTPLVRKHLLSRDFCGHGQTTADVINLAETEGFEPSIRLNSV